MFACCMEEGGLVNIVLSLSVVVYRHVILAFDVIVFIMKASTQMSVLLYTVQCVQECNPGIQRQYINICCIVHAIYRHVILAFDIIVFIMKVSTIFVHDTVHHFIVQYVSMSS